MLKQGEMNRARTYVGRVWTSLISWVFVNETCAQMEIKVHDGQIKSTGDIYVPDALYANGRT